MSRDTGQVVSPPATDRPALADPTTATLLAEITRRARSATSGFALAPLVGLSVGSYLYLGSAFEPGFVLLTVAMLACFVAMIVHAAWVHLRAGRALPSLRRMLSAQAWRPVPATIRGTLVELDDGSRLRVPGMYDAVREVIARTGRVWLVGPGPKGWLALRIDGSHAPWPARRVRSRAAVPARQPEPPGTTGTAADDPVAARWASTAVRLLLLRLWPLPFLIVVFVLIALGMSVATGAVVPWLVFALALGLPCVIILAVRLRRTRDHRRLPELLRAGPWVRVDVDGTDRVRLEDGGTLRIALPGANADLLGAIRETGTVWLAGEPVAGRTVAAGFPGYPLLGVARLS